MKNIEFIFYTIIIITLAIFAYNYLCPKKENFKPYSDYDCEPGDMCIGEHGGTGKCRRSGVECFMPIQNY